MKGSLSSKSNPHIAAIFFPVFTILYLFYLRYQGLLLYTLQPFKHTNHIYDLRHKLLLFLISAAFKIKTLLFLIITLLGAFLYFIVFSHKIQCQ